MGKDVQFPLFLKCCTYIQNSFWKYVFEEMAYGNFPYGTYIFRGFLCCSYKDREFSYNIEKEQDPKILYENVYTLLREKLEMISEDEQKQNFDDFKKMGLYDGDWSSIRKKSVRAMILENFVIKMKHKYNLTIAQSRKLLDTISYMISFKLISSDNIEYTDGEILLIRGIDFSEKKYRIRRKVIKTTDRQSDAKSEERIKISDLWNKYLARICKNANIKLKVCDP